MRVVQKETAICRVGPISLIQQSQRRSKRQKETTKVPRSCRNSHRGMDSATPKMVHPTETMQIEEARLRTRQPSMGEDDLACLLHY